MGVGWISGAHLACRTSDKFFHLVELGSNLVAWVLFHMSHHMLGLGLLTAWCSQDSKSSDMVTDFQEKFFTKDIHQCLKSLNKPLAFFLTLY